MRVDANRHPAIPSRPHRPKSARRTARSAQPARQGSPSRSPLRHRMPVHRSQNTATAAPTLPCSNNLAQVVTSTCCAPSRTPMIDRLLHGDTLAPAHTLARVRLQQKDRAPSEPQTTFRKGHQRQPSEKAPRPPGQRSLVGRQRESSQATIVVIGANIRRRDILLELPHVRGPGDGTTLGLRRATERPPASGCPERLRSHPAIDSGCRRCRDSALNARRPRLKLRGTDV